MTKRTLLITQSIYRVKIDGRGDDFVVETSYGAIDDSGEREYEDNIAPTYKQISDSETFGEFHLADEYAGEAWYKFGDDYQTSENILAMKEEAKKARLSND